MAEGGTLNTPSASGLRTTALDVVADKTYGSPIPKVSIVRTARRLFEGSVFAEIAVATPKGAVVAPSVTVPA